MRITALVLLLGAAFVAIPGCTSIVDAVVDDVVNPGGKLTTTLNAQPLGEVTALASGNPLSITGSSATFVVSMTVGDDPTGRTGFDALAKAGQQVSITIAPSTRNHLQAHFGGQSCVASSGSLMLSTDSNNDIGGTFEGSGTQSSDGTPCTLSGTLMAIPQAR